MANQANHLIGSCPELVQTPMNFRKSTHKLMHIIQIYADGHSLVHVFVIRRNHEQGLIYGITLLSVRSQPTKCERKNTANVRGTTTSELRTIFLQNLEGKLLANQSAICHICQRFTLPMFPTLWHQLISTTKWWKTYIGLTSDSCNNTCKGYIFLLVAMFVILHI